MLSNYQEVFSVVKNSIKQDDRIHYKFQFVNGRGYIVIYRFKRVDCGVDEEIIQRIACCSTLVELDFLVREMVKIMTQ